MARVFILVIAFILQYNVALSQKQDTVVVNGSLPRPSVLERQDSLYKARFNPRKATIRSAIIPGWGQAYNKKYWKIPLVYGAIGVPTYTFFYNKKWYNETRKAAKMLASDPPDTANYRNRIDEKLWAFFSTPNGLNSLLNYRNQFRRDMDYSILFIILTWGLNVVDATVDAHLKGFDISDNLSLQIKPTILQGSSTAGMSFVFTLGGKSSKTITSRAK